FPLISQIGISYRDDSLSEQTDDDFEDVKAGDRLPYFLVDGESIFEKLKSPKFHVLLFSKGERNACDQFERFGELSDCHRIPIDARVSEIFGTEDDFGLLLRPDNHIAFISAQLSPDKVAEYLQNHGFLKV